MVTLVQIIFIMDRLNAGNPVTGKDFIGREEEIAKITQLLSFGQSVAM